jgi:hypothetical protein
MATADKVAERRLRAAGSDWSNSPHSTTSRPSLLDHGTYGGSYDGEHVFHIGAEGGHGGDTDDGDQSEKQTVLGQGCALLVTTKATDQLEHVVEHVKLHRLEHVEILCEVVVMTGSATLFGEHFLPIDDSIIGEKVRLK